MCVDCDWLVICVRVKMMMMLSAGSSGPSPGFASGFTRAMRRLAGGSMVRRIIAENISDLVVTHHTQAIIDTFAFKTPVIHHQKITKAWKKYWKKESHFNYFGVKLIQTEEDFYKKLKTLMRKKIKTNYKNINEFTNLSIFKRK